MAVIINEFEILTQTPPQGADNAPQPAPAPQQPQLEPLDVERILRWHMERLARVRAH